MENNPDAPPDATDVSPSGLCQHKFFVSQDILTHGQHRCSSAHIKDLLAQRN
jgi:hypothetical protein